MRHSVHVCCSPAGFRLTTLDLRAPLSLHGCCQGGGITVETRGSVTLRSNTFEANTAENGGCALHVGAPVDATSSALVSNTFLVSSTHCASQQMIVVRSPLSIPCELGTWMSPRPLSLPPMQHNFTSCAFSCVAGTFGNTANLTDASCSGQCPKGHYCPSGTAFPIQCPVGTYLDSKGAASPRSCLPCIPGSFSNVSARSTNGCEPWATARLDPRSFAASLC